MKPLRDLVNGWPIYDWGPAARDAIRMLWTDHMRNELRVFTRIEEVYRQHQRREAGLE